MLSLLIVMMIFGTLVPTMLKMQQTLDDKQLRVSAFETLHEAAKIMKATGATSGERSVNAVLFQWEYSGQLCVAYNNYRSSQETVCAK